jgi:hypothetical protein
MDVCAGACSTPSFLLGATLHRSVVSLGCRDRPVPTLADAGPAAGSGAKDAGSGSGAGAAASDDAIAGNGPTIITDGYNEIAIGCFVFLRNARFNPVSESTSNPRYWVARVTAGAVATPAVRAHDARARVQDAECVSVFGGGGEEAGPWSRRVL